MSEVATLKPTAKTPDLTHADVLAIAKNLNADHILTTAWTKEHLLSKSAAEFEEAELKKLAKELDDHLKAYLKANS